MACTFFLGTHHPEWLGKTDMPLFVSRRRFHRCRRPPAARGPWAVDSGGFSELGLFGRWDTPPSQYVAEVRLWREKAGRMEWAAIQDWMCEPLMLAKTGLSVREHQKRTLDSWEVLRHWAPEVPWVPVLQGWLYEDYFQHLDDFKSAGTDLATLPLVGLGSVCRRQDTDMVEELIHDLAGLGLRLHAFGFKTLGLPRAAAGLVSADSMAWSAAARRQKVRLPGCRHRTCTNCLRWALQWREKVLRQAARPRPLRAQPRLW